MKTLVLVLIFSIYFPQAQFCQEKLFEKYPICEDGNSVNRKTGCCDRTRRCPESCLSSRWASRGRNYSCTCSHCKLVPKIHLTNQRRWLNAHNYFRCRHNVQVLKWNYDVERNAQKLTNLCKYTHSKNTYLGSSYKFNPSSGENIAKGFGSIEQTVFAWYDEIQKYVPHSKGGQGTGHFTALMWKTTGDLGCSRCDAEKIDVCQYANTPPNYGYTDAYIKNVPQNKASVNSEYYCCEYIYGSSAPVHLGHVHFGQDQIPVKLEIQHRKKKNSFQFAKANSCRKTGHYLKRCAPCIYSLQCQNKYFCCPYLKKCVQNGHDPCTKPIAFCKNCHEKSHGYPHSCAISCKNKNFPDQWMPSTCPKKKNLLLGTNKSISNKFSEIPLMNGMQSREEEEEECPIIGNYVEHCGRCIYDQQCAPDHYCSLYMKKCVNHTWTACYLPIAKCNITTPKCEQNSIGYPLKCKCVNQDYPQNWVECTHLEKITSSEVKTERRLTKPKDQEQTKSNLQKLPSSSIYSKCIDTEVQIFIGKGRITEQMSWYINNTCGDSMGSSDGKTPSVIKQNCCMVQGATYTLHCEAALGNGWGLGSYIEIAEYKFCENFKDFSIEETFILSKTNAGDVAAEASKNLLPFCHYKRSQQNGMSQMYSRNIKLLGQYVVKRSFIEPYSQDDVDSGLDNTLIAFIVLLCVASVFSIWFFKFYKNYITTKNQMKHLKQFGHADLLVNGLTKRS